MTDNQTYGCHSSKTGDWPRGELATHLMQPTTEWLPVLCGHNLRETDPACSGCSRRTEFTAEEST